MNENAQRERDSKLLVKWEVVLLMLDTTNRRHWAPGGTKPGNPPQLSWEKNGKGGRAEGYYQITGTILLHKPIGVI